MNKRNNHNFPEDDFSGRVGRGGTFPVPEDYFGVLNQKIYQRINNRKEASDSRDSNSFTLKKSRYLIIPAAAAALAVLFIFTFQLLSRKESAQSVAKGNGDYIFNSYVNYLLYTTPFLEIAPKVDQSTISDSSSLTNISFKPEDSAATEAAINYLYLHGYVLQTQEW